MINLLMLICLLNLNIWTEGSAMKERFETAFVRDFFNERNIKVAVLFACSLQESIDLLKMLVNNRTVISKYGYFDTYPIFKNIMTAPYNKLGVYLNYSCEFGKRMLTKSSHLNMFNDRFIWLLIGEDKMVLNDKLEIINLRLDTDMTLATTYKNKRDDNNKNILLYDLYRISNDSTTIVNEAGYWNDENKLIINFKGTRLERRQDLRGLTITGTGVNTEIEANGSEEALKLFLDPFYNSYLDLNNRFPLSVCMDLTELYNFTLKVNFARNWGVLQEDGFYDEMLGDIQKGVSDIGLSTVSIRNTRLNVMDFSFPIWKFRPIFLYLNRKKYTHLHEMLLPFSTEMWLTIFLLMVTFIVILTFAKRIKFHDGSIYYKNDGLGGYGVIDKSWSENSIVIIGVLCGQGLSSCSTRFPERIVLFICLVLCMCISLYYNANVMKSLLYPRAVAKYTYEQLINSNINFGAQDIIYYKDFFQQSNVSLIKDIYNKKMKNKINNFVTPDEGMRLVRTTEYAFYAEEPVLYRIAFDTFSGDEVCRMVEIEMIQPYHISCPIKKESHLKQYINCGFAILREAGIITREYKKWHKPKPACRRQVKVSRVRMNSLLDAYAILIFGMILSMLILSSELYYYKKTQISKKLKLSINSLRYQRIIAKMMKR